MSATVLSRALDIQGNLIAADLTPDLAAGKLKGQAPEEFGFSKTTKLSDEIAMAWADAKAYWSAFQRGLARSPETDPATSITRELLAVPLLRSLGYQPVYTAKAEVVDGQTFAISHRADEGDAPPIHIVGARVKLEERPPSGTPRLSAHALVQEYLNRTEHLWAIATNGLRWRLLRDSSLMTRLTYVEFDLEQILEGDRFAEFGLFYRLFHRSRLPQGMDDADRCLLEFYHQESVQQGGRVRDRLRDGVERALKILGTGFLQHPQSQDLRDQWTAGGLTAEDYYRQVLRLIYRLLFLMVAEARDLLVVAADPATAAEKARIYRDYYSIERLRAIAEQPTTRREGFQDLWQGLRVTFRLFDENWRGELLGLSPLNGDLFGSQSLRSLDGCGLDNHDLLRSLRELSLYVDGDRLRRVNYGALDVEELGSVYESLLDFQPQIIVREGIYEFDLVVGSDRKTTGSYYTPPELVGQLIQSALEPVLADRLGAAGADRPAQEAAILSIKVCDPACGSGHFLLAAVRRLGKALAQVRSGETEPGKDATQRAKREILRHCIYGVDLNPLAVDLCKVALWLEGLSAGLPLNFLDHRIKQGNSLVGVLRVADLDGGIPDRAFTPVTGDDKKTASQIKARNKQELKGLRTPKADQLDLLVSSAKAAARANYGPEMESFAALPDGSSESVRAMKRAYDELRGETNASWWSDWVAANLWTAAFFALLPSPENSEALALVPTTGLLRRVMAAESLGELATTEPVLARLIHWANGLAQELSFFHWELEFPEVFQAGGFDCILGNPPWERIKLQEKEFFGNKDRAIAEAKNSAARKKLINALPADSPLALAWQRAQHFADAQGKFIRESGRFPLTSRGDINTYAIFSELDRDLISEAGFAGIIVPTGIATDATTATFFSDITQKQNLVTFFDFENRESIFPSVDSRFRFVLMTLTGGINTEINFLFFLANSKQISDKRRRIQLLPSDLKMMNPNTLTCPIFRTGEDVKLTGKIYKTFPVLDNEASGKNPWNVSFMTMLHMSGDSNLFLDQGGNDRLPLYEAKMFTQFDHRHLTYEGITENTLVVNVVLRPTDEQKQNPNYAVTPRYWVDRTEVEKRLGTRWEKGWLIGWRDITSATNERTFISSVLPISAFGDTVLLMLPKADSVAISGLVGNLNSLVFDFVARQKVGGTHLKFFTARQLPVIPPERYSQADLEFIAPRVLELTYTAWDLQPFAQDLWHDDSSAPSLLNRQTQTEQLGLGIDPPPVSQLELGNTPTHDPAALRRRFVEQWQANRRHDPDITPTPAPDAIDPDSDQLPLPPFVWHPQRRAQIRAELDAYYARLYGLTRDELRYILDPADLHGPDFPSETFRVLKNNEIKQFGEYRTQRLVLAAWDRLFGRS